MTAKTVPVNNQSGFMNMLYRPPWVGLMAFVIVFVFQGIGHTIMIVMENVWPGEHYIYESAFALGLFGAVLLFYGMRSDKEVAATWLGFWAGSFLWTGWVEFAFVWSGDFLQVPDLMDPNIAGEIVTKAEYLVMMSSVGVLAATLAYFLLNPETKCNMFLWLQRNAKLKTGKPTKGHKRNFAAITALETIYVIWFFYLVLLFLYNDDIAGDKSIAAYVFFFLNTIWAVYLFQRLIKFWRVTTAIRYGIPTAIIAWNSIELMGRWNLFTSIWEKPQEFWLEMTLFTVAIVIAAFLAVKTPAHKKAELSRQQAS
ncbi:MAG: hypothetical protein GY727_14495 [Gammaproteobacteria bacterium]|nr:hypothetical protein [Gammaproteobacteria bacterium]MCP4089419.1 hypothetical protein [Gammaproteobacteria bacterium]MCP4277534.1 hypothetical protein [Gammaproteobacteria bacterium]MCP4831142.1 hypothetical protein [Gammaproteobacteria bacterium]MCP4928565.1 hypothetical protein [Gammaproteobacteria bacterium]